MMRLKLANFGTSAWPTKLKTYKTFKTVFCSRDAPFHPVSQRLLDIVISCLDCNVFF